MRAPHVQSTSSRLRRWRNPGAGVVPVRVLALWGAGAVFATSLVVANPPTSPLGTLGCLILGVYVAATLRGWRTGARSE